MFPEGRIVEFLIVGVVALIVVGPKDLPVLMRKVGQFMARMRAMAAEFRASFDEMARQSELDELRREVDALRAGVPAAIGLVHEAGVQTAFDDIDASLHGVQGAQVEPRPRMDYQYPARFPPMPDEPAPAEPSASPPDSAAAKAPP
jgi:sec-independent protein translocase protein TatB